MDSETTPDVDASLVPAFDIQRCENKPPTWIVDLDGDNGWEFTSHAEAIHFALVIRGAMRKHIAKAFAAGRDARRRAEGDA